MVFLCFVIGLTGCTVEVHKLQGANGGVCVSPLVQVMWNVSSCWSTNSGPWTRCQCGARTCSPLETRWRATWTPASGRRVQKSSSLPQSAPTPTSGQAPPFSPLWQTPLFPLCVHSLTWSCLRCRSSHPTSRESGKNWVVFGLLGN